MMQPNPSHSTAPTATDLAEPLSVVLSDPRRRRVLRVLASNSARRTSFDDLATAVSAFEQPQRDDAPGAAASEVEVTLYHCHLPKLAEAGLIKEGYQDGPVALTETGLKCARILDD